MVPSRPLGKLAVARGTRLRRHTHINAPEGRRAPGKSLRLTAHGHDELLQADGIHAAHEVRVPTDVEVCLDVLAQLALEGSHVIRLSCVLLALIAPKVNLIAQCQFVLM